MLVRSCYELDYKSRSRPAKAKEQAVRAVGRTATSNTGYYSNAVGLAVRSPGSYGFASQAVSLEIRHAAIQFCAGQNVRLERVCETLGLVEALRALNIANAAETPEKPPQAI